MSTNEQQHNDLMTAYDLAELVERSGGRATIVVQADQESWTLMVWTGLRARAESAVRNADPSWVSRYLHGWFPFLGRYWYQSGAVPSPPPIEVHPWWTAQMGPLPTTEVSHG